MNKLSAQSLSLQTTIEPSLQETSGLLYLNGKLITHTDSGGEPALYEMDTTDGSPTRKVVIQNATNIDWEDISMDDDFIYIGDFGNNQGNRTNLRIYKIDKQDYLTNDTVLADTLQFDYSDQTDFTPSTFSTNYDAEALISYGDSLYIFTKNWGNSRTNIYPISKKPGTYSLVKTDSVNSQGWITSAVCDSAQKQILLIGYTFNTAFYLKINNWNHLFSTGLLSRKILQPNSSIQIEGVAQIDNTHFFISSEKFQTTVSELHVLDCQLPTKADEPTLLLPIIYPNPCHDKLYIDFQGRTVICIYSLDGKLLLKTNNKIVDINQLAIGVYQVQLNSEGKIFYQKLQIL